MKQNFENSEASSHVETRTTLQQEPSSQEETKKIEESFQQTTGGEKGVVESALKEESKIGSPNRAPQSASPCRNPTMSLAARGRAKCRVRTLMDEASVEMFLSTDEMERMEKEAGWQRTGGARRPQLQRQYSDDTKKRHEKVVRQILQDFDLEECKNKYRNLGAYEKRITGKR